MRPIFARGTLTWGERARVGLLPDVDHGGSTTTLIEQVLRPQHANLAHALETLRSSVVGLARRDRTAARVIRRAAGMLDELSELVFEQLDHEERALFPFLAAGTAPIHGLGRVHDHHTELDERLRRLRGLSAELRSADEIDGGVLALFEGVGIVTEFAEIHRDTEQTVLLARYG